MRIHDPETPTIAALILRLARPALRPAFVGVVTLLLAGACGDDVQGPPDEGPDGPSAPSAQVLSTLIVSNPVRSASAAGASLSFGGVASSEEIVFVSLPPGSVPGGETALIQTRGTEAEASATMEGGGFDPIPIAAGTGDTLDIRIELAGGETLLAFYAVVPPPIPPVIVRTDPPPKKRDVPLNALMMVVFSEPIDAATLTASSVQVILDGAPVAGTLEFGDGFNMTATFTPAEQLAPGAEYSLLVTSGIEDLDGDALAEEFRVDFSTAVPPPAGSRTLAIVSGNNQPGKAGRDLPEPLLVRVTDATGAGVPDVEVTWKVTAGEGALDGQWVPCPPYTAGAEEVWFPVASVSGLTDADGLARVSFMPTWFGPVTVAASVPGAAVTFATDASDAGATLEVVPGNGEAHEPWIWSFFGWIHHPPLVVTVKDGQGTPVPNVAVHWAGEGRLFHCGWSLSAQVAYTRSGDAQASTHFEPSALGPHTVMAFVPGIEGSPVRFEMNATVALIWLEPVESGVVFSGPEGRGHSDVVVPVGARVEFSVLAPSAHIVSTASPPGGVRFDSGILSRNSLGYDPEAEPLFGFVPNVAGTWTFVDQVSGASGTLTAQ